jgi:hypothetical protein
VWVTITRELSGLFVTNRAQNLHDARSFRTQHGPPARVHRADPKKLEIATGRIFIEMLIAPIPFDLKATPAEYKAGLDPAIARGWLLLRENGSFVTGLRTPARSCFA